MVSSNRRKRSYDGVFEIFRSGFAITSVSVVVAKYYLTDAKRNIAYPCYFRGLGHHYIQKFGKVGEISAVLCEKANLPPNAQLKIYEVNKLSIFVILILLDSSI